MGAWDEMCLVCGGPPYGDVDQSDLLSGDESESEAEQLRAVNLEGLEWLGKHVGITEAEELVPLGPYNFYGSYDLDEGRSGFSGASVFTAMTPWPEDDPYGLTCHEKCYRLLERDLQYTLRFHDVWPMLMQQADQCGSWLNCTDYGGMAAYIEQIFDFRQLFLDGNGWMLQDPTTNRANAERILNVWRPIIQSGFQVESEDGSQAALDVHQTASQTA